MRLLKYEGYKVVIDPEILVLKPFRDLWKRDRTKEKERALLEIAFIYFMVDPRSDYQYLTDDEQRKEAIKEGEGLPAKWEPDKAVLAAMEFYNSFKSASALLLEDTKAMIAGYRGKMRQLTANMEDLGVKETKEIGAIIKQIPLLVKDLNEAEKALAKEDTASGRMRGQGEKTIFEDGLNI